MVTECPDQFLPESQVGRRQVERVGQEDGPFPSGIGWVQGHRLDEGPGGMIVDKGLLIRVGDGQGLLDLDDGLPDGGAVNGGGSVDGGVHDDGNRCPWWGQR